MKIKRVISIILLGLFAVALAACAAQPTPVYAEGAEKDQAAAAAEPFTRHILDGITTNSYELFAGDFDSSMKTAMTQAQFDKIVAMFSGYGAFQGRELVNVQVVDTYYRVNYKLTFENKVVIMGVVIPSGESPLVSGLWFN
jgi:hypothetical protein